MSERAGPLNVTVAAFGPSFMHELGLFGGPTLENQGPEVPYAERMKAVLEVELDETLGSVLDRAAAEFGVVPGRELAGSRISEVITGVVFYLPEDEAGLYRSEPWPDLIRLLDEEGTPSWGVPWALVRYRELLEASKAGLIEGDPRRAYLWPVIPQGEPVTVGLALLGVLWILERVLGGAVEELGATVARAAIDRVRRVRELGDKSSEWRERLARPDDFVTYLRRKPITTSDAAAVLHCSDEDAEAVLWGMGFGHDEASGRWIWRGDPAAAIIASQLERARVEAREPTKQGVLREMQDEQGESRRS